MDSSSNKSQLNGTHQYEIPASVRQDGSIRKARRVKPGFVPQEEVPLYQAKGKRILAQSSPYPPGWHPTPAAPSKKVEKPKVKTGTEKQSKPPQPKPSQPKSQLQATEKPKSKDKKDITATTNKMKEIDEVSEKLEDLNIDLTVEISKRLKRLRRKLREAELLEEKIKSGLLEGPEKDQLIKLENKKKFEEEIEKLEKEREKLRKKK